MMKCPQWCHKLRVITVEPVVLLNSLASPLVWPAFSLMVYQKVCRQHFTSDICHNLGNGSYSDEEDVVQTESSHYFFYSNLAFEIPSVIIAFYYGVISDNISRKVAMILPLIGAALSMFSDIINALYMDAHVGFCLIPRVISGLFGGWIAFNLSIFSYLGAVTDEKSRTVRIGIVEGSASVCYGVSLFISGYILDNTSFVFVFSLGTVINVFAAIYTMIFIRNIQDNTQEKESVRKALTNTKHMKDSLMCVFRKREGRGRTFLLALLSSYIIRIVAFGAMFSLGFLYLKRQPLSWSQTTYGIYNGYACLLGGAFILFVFPWIKKKTQVRDTTMLIFTTVTGAISLVMYGLSKKTWMIFLVPVVTLANDTGPTCMRALLSFMVQPEELGKVYAAMGVVQSVSGFISHVIYNNVYPLTLDSWPGLCFLGGAVVDVFGLAVLVWLHISLKKKEAYEELKDEKPLSTGKDPGKIDDQSYVTSKVV